MRKFWLWLLPELQLFPAQRQAEALKKSRQGDLDIPELLGMALGLVLAAIAAQYASPGNPPLPHAVVALLDFVIAVPLMAMVVIPFHIRRLRRGLRVQLQLHESP